MAKERKTSEFVPPPLFFFHYKAAADKPTTTPIATTAAPPPTTTSAAATTSTATTSSTFDSPRPRSADPSSVPRLSLGRKFSQEFRSPPVPLNSSADDFIFLDRISTSTMSDVVRVKRKDTHEILAVKAFSHESWRSKYLCHAELRVLQDIPSPWLIGFYGFIKDFSEDFLLFEYLPNGSLLELVTKHKLTENQTKFYAAEMFLAVNSLHEYGIMHRNIQLSNFLIHKSGHLRIIGFGLSYQFKTSLQLSQESTATQSESTDNEKPAGSKLQRSIRRKRRRPKPKLHRITNPVFSTSDKEAIPLPGTGQEGGGGPSGTSADVAAAQLAECSTGYMAPEVLRLVMPKPFLRVAYQKPGYSYLCDYWSLGVAVYRMLYEHYPFTADSKGLILDKVVNFRKTLTFPLSGVSVAASSFVKELMKKENHRLGRMRGLTEVQNHPVFEDMQWERLGHGKVTVPIRTYDLSRYTDEYTRSTSLSNILFKKGSAPAPVAPTLKKETVPGILKQTMPELQKETLIPAVVRTAEYQQNEEKKMAKRAEALEAQSSHSSGELSAGSSSEESLLKGDNEEDGEEGASPRTMDSNMLSQLNHMEVPLCSDPSVSDKGFLYDAQHSQRVRLKTSVSDITLGSRHSMVPRELRGRGEEERGYLQKLASWFSSTAMEDSSLTYAE